MLYWDKGIKNVRNSKSANTRWRQIPAGMRDLTAAEVSQRRGVESRLIDTFTRWGYVEVATPTLEYLETLTRGTGPSAGDRLLKLVDSGGEVLALRPEMTVPLARLAATRLLPAGSMPLRLAYICSVFRGQERGSGMAREFTQAGVELIGDGSAHADAEIIGLAGSALRAAGIREPIIAIGHAGFLRGVLSGLPPAAAEAARDLLYRRAFADLDATLPPGPELAALRALPTLRGDGALARAGAFATVEESQRALDALENVTEHARRYDGGVRIEVDLAQIRDFDYYTGVIFEAHAPRSAVPLLGGGRYDNLLERFGHGAPATGFAIGVEYVLDAQERSSVGTTPVVVVFAPGEHTAAVRAATRLREAGLAVIMAAAGDPVPGEACVIAVDSDRIVVHADGRKTACTPDALVDTVRAQAKPTT
jgi:ATP phosphoribosyltransferase regulatory subunit